jgi:4-hydroxybenzoate polyprenyltransferase
MRGAGCGINDYWDRDFDAKVERTRSRPIAGGSMTGNQALVWIGAQTAMSAGILLALPVER